MTKILIIFAVMLFAVCANNPVKQQIVVDADGDTLTQEQIDSIWLADSNGYYWPILKEYVYKYPLKVGTHNMPNHNNVTIYRVWVYTWLIEWNWPVDSIIEKSELILRDSNGVQFEPFQPYWYDRSVRFMAYDDFEYNMITDSATKANYDTARVGATFELILTTKDSVYLTASKSIQSIQSYQTLTAIPK